MSKPDGWYPHYIADYAADTMHLTTVQHGAYRLLMDAYWRNQGPLNDDDEALAAITRLPLKDWRKMRPVIARFFQVSGSWRHKRIEAELTKARHNSEQKANAGRASAEAKRQRKINGDGNGNSTAVGTGQPTEDERQRNGAATPHSSPSPEAASAASSPTPEQALARKANDVRLRLCEILGTDENRHRAWARTDAITGWLQAGCDPDLDILPTARAVLARRGNSGPPGSPAYLTEAVLEAHRTRTASASTPAPAPATPPDPAREEAARKCNEALDRWIAGGREGSMPKIEDFLAQAAVGALDIVSATTPAAKASAPAPASPGGQREASKLASAA